MSYSPLSTILKYVILDQFDKDDYTWYNITIFHAEAIDWLPTDSNDLWHHNRVGHRLSYILREDLFVVFAMRWS